MKRSLRNTLAGRESELILATVEFATLNEIKSVKQVERIFRPVSSVPDLEFRTLKPGEHEAYRDDQEKLLVWLEPLSLRNVSRRARRDVADDVNALMREAVEMEPPQAVERRGKLVQVPGRIITDKGVQACCAYAVLILLDEERRLYTKLKRCKVHDCPRERLFFDLPRRGRPPKEFCSEQCASLYRTRKYRRGSDAYS